jgi:hypothetical protein
MTLLGDASLVMSGSKLNASLATKPHLVYVRTSNDTMAAEQHAERMIGLVAAEC